MAPQYREAFEALCSEYQDIFSKDSADLGKTPLLKMDIPIGDSPPITQRPYTLALKHVQWVQEEIETQGTKSDKGIEATYKCIFLAWCFKDDQSDSVKRGTAHLKLR